MTKAELNEIIKNALTSNTLNSKKFFEVRTSANERCREYISKQPDKDRPGFTDYIDFQMESLYYSAIEEFEQRLHATPNSMEFFSYTHQLLVDFP
jgi:hypothetical protein